MFHVLIITIPMRLIKNSTFCQKNLPEAFPKVHEGHDETLKCSKPAEVGFLISYALIDLYSTKYNMKRESDWNIIKKAKPTEFNHMLIGRINMIIPSHKSKKIFSIFKSEEPNIHAFSSYQK